MSFMMSSPARRRPGPAPRRAPGHLRLVRGRARAGGPPRGHGLPGERGVDRGQGPARGRARARPPELRAGGAVRRRARRLLRRPDRRLPLPSHARGRRGADPHLDAAGPGRVADLRRDRLRDAQGPARLRLLPGRGAHRLRPRGRLRARRPGPHRAGPRRGGRHGRRRGLHVPGDAGSRGPAGRAQPERSGPGRRPGPTRPRRTLSMHPRPGRRRRAGPTPPRTPTHSRPGPRRRRPPAPCPPGWTAPTA